MSVASKQFLWMYFRICVWVAAISFALLRGTGNRKVVRGFVLSHVVALAFGLVIDVGLFAFAPRSWLRLDVLQWVFTAPIAIFTVISLWIGSWEIPVEPPDVFMALVPVVAWGLLVIFGWQWRMAECHVLGAWFVSAAAGAIDLWTRYGAERVRRRSWLARFAGYAVVVLLVYLVLPRTEMQFPP